MKKYYQYDFFTQALCREYYKKPKNLVVIQFIKYPNFEFKNWKKIWQTSESGGYFQILIRDNYEQTNGIQLQYFYTNLMLEILQLTKELSIMHFKDHNFEFSIWTPPEKSWAFFQILNVK